MQREELRKCLIDIVNVALAIVLADIIVKWVPNWPQVRQWLERKLRRQE